MASCRGPVECFQCGHRWIVLCPPKSTPVRCPKCGVRTWTLLWKPDTRAPEVSAN